MDAINSSFIKAKARELGFSACGIARAEHVDDWHSGRFCSWLDKGFNAEMAYMHNYEDIRLDPRLLLEGCKSVVSLALNYYPRTRLTDSQFQFAFYAYGKDYHDVMRDRLQQLAKSLTDNDLSLRIRCCCDTAPILDRYWAWKSGIGWIGKNTNLIIPHAGSFFFLGELLIDKELDYDSPVESRCGSCTKCMDACPTGALGTTCGLDSRKCLSYLTIENRGEIPESVSSKLKNYIYGCDRCQLACPHNRYAQPTDVGEFTPSDEFMNMDPQAWRALSVEDYRRLFKGSAVKRAKFEGLTRNIACAAEF